MRRFLATLLTPLTIVGASACAQEYPGRPDGPVLDLAEIIPDASERSLDSRLRHFYDRTCRSVVVATVPTLKGKAIESYATNLFNRWGIGSADRDDGILLLVAPTERKVRIEVGLGLEQAMPNAVAAAIIQHNMTPSYRAGDFPGGIAHGIDAILLKLEPSSSTGECARRKAA